MAELEGPDRVGCAHVQRAVAGDARGPGIAGDRLADRLGPARDQARRGRPADRSATARAGRAQTACPGVTSTTCAGSIGSAPRCVAVITACSIVAIRSASTRRRRESSSERTSSSSKSGADGSSSASASRSASSDRRCSPWEPNRRRSRPAGADPHVVEMRPETRRAAGEVAAEAGLERGRGRRIALVAQGRGLEAELLRARREARRDRRRAPRAAPRRARRRATRPAPSRARAHHGSRGRAARA